MKKKVWQVFFCAKINYLAHSLQLMQCLCFETELVHFYRSELHLDVVLKDVIFFFQNLSFKIRGAAYLRVWLIHECLR